jgi:hypothetical protein
MPGSLADRAKTGAYLLRLVAEHADTMTEMKHLLTPWSIGVNAVRHLGWYLSYQVSGETRPRD